jgi:hypothetical protein
MKSVISASVGCRQVGLVREVQRRLPLVHVVLDLLRAHVGGPVLELGAHAGVVEHDPLLGFREQVVAEEVPRGRVRSARPMPGVDPIVKMKGMTMPTRRTAKISLKWCWKVRWIQEIIWVKGTRG